MGRTRHRCAILIAIDRSSMRPAVVVTRQVAVYSVPTSPPLTHTVACVVVLVAAVCVRPVSTVHTTELIVSVVSQSPHLMV